MGDLNLTMKNRVVVFSLIVQISCPRPTHVTRRTTVLVLSEHKNYLEKSRNLLSIMHIVCTAVRI
jgi:hypothetical protein